MPNTWKILVVDDDSELRESLTEQLLLHEFDAVAAKNGCEGVQAVKVGQTDLVIMDIGLPDIDGREVVRILRKNGFKAPIIMLTGQCADSDTILGLESGADDYVSKPFRFAVLLARVRAQLRLHEASENIIFRPFSVVAASELAPPMPEPGGMRLWRWNAAGSLRRATRCITSCACSTELFSLPTVRPEIVSPVASACSITRRSCRSIA